jgi:hypothetical protein
MSDSDSDDPMNEMQEEEYLMEEIKKGGETGWAMKELIQLYLKVGLPTAAKHYCTILQSALRSSTSTITGQEGAELAVECMRLLKTAKEDIVTPRLRFKLGDRVVCRTGSDPEGVIRKS